MDTEKKRDELIEESSKKPVGTGSEKEDKKLHQSMLLRIGTNSVSLFKDLTLFFGEYLDIVCLRSW